MDTFAADKNGSVNFIEPTTSNKYSYLDQLRWMDTINTILEARILASCSLNSGPRPLLIRK
jgi:hypothetical protein